MIFDQIIPESKQPARELFINLAGFIPLFVAGLFVPRIYGRSTMSAISLDARFSIKTFAIGAAAWAAIMGLTTGTSFVLSPDFYVWTFKAELFIPAVVVGLVLLPIQTGAEELLFRSYIPQVFSRVISSKLAITAISSVMFALPHLPNPEAQEKPLAALIAYTAIGWAFTAGAISVGRLEISMGAHFINNSFSLFVVGYANSALPSAALWTTPAGDMNATAVSTVVFTAVWLGVLKLLKKKSIV